MVINSSIGSLHDDSDDPPISQVSSQTPSHRSWTVDKIASLQSDTDTTKARLDDLRKSVDTQISSFQTNLKADLTTQISALRSMVELKVDKVESKIDKVESKIDTFQTEMRHSLSELRVELDNKMLGHSMDLKQHEVRLIWRVFFAVSVVLIFIISYLLILYRL